MTLTDFLLARIVEDEAAAPALRRPRRLSAGVEAVKFLERYVR